MEKDRRKGEEVRWETSLVYSGFLVRMLMLPMLCDREFATADAAAAAAATA